MKNILKTVGKRIAKERLKQDLSQEKLAELANLHRNHIGLLERGEVDISLQNIYKIALALKIPLEIIIKDF